MAIRDEQLEKEESEKLIWLAHQVIQNTMMDPDDDYDGQVFESKMNYHDETGETRVRNTKGKG